MLISIIVPTLNAAKSLPVMLRQLSERTDVELLVVDGGSTDGTIEIAQSFTPYVFLSQPGQARQLNTGARHATGDILLFLPADTFLLPLALDDFQRRIVGTGAVGSVRAEPNTVTFRFSRYGVKMRDAYRSSFNADVITFMSNRPAWSSSNRNAVSIISAAKSPFPPPPCARTSCCTSA